MDLRDGLTFVRHAPQYKLTTYISYQIFDERKAKSFARIFLHIRCFRRWRGKTFSCIYNLNGHNTVLFKAANGDLSFFQADHAVLNSIGYHLIENEIGRASCRERV